MSHAFIVGEQRSGSNLLRVMLAQAGIAAPHPPHLLTRLGPLLPLYGPLSNDDGWAALIDDCCTLVERNPVPWTPLGRLCRRSIGEHCRERSLIAVFGAVMDGYAEAQGAERWVCKSMHYAQFASALDAYFDDPKYVYLYRDGRDVALSFMRSVVGEKHPYHTAKRWAEAQRTCMTERRRIGPERFLSVCYEDLTREPQAVLEAVCAFLGVPFRLEMLDFERSQQARSAAARSQLWSNLDKPILKNNSRKFLTGLSEEALTIVESVAGDVLRDLGYETVAVEPGQERVFSPNDLARFSRENERAKAASRAQMDPSDAWRRARQLAVLTQRRFSSAEPNRQSRSLESLALGG